MLKVPLVDYVVGIVGRGVCRSYYKGHKDKMRGEGRGGEEVGLARVEWRDGEKMQTIVTE